VYVNWVPDVVTVAVWRRSFAPQATGAEVDSGHFVAEEAPEATLAALQAFLGAPQP